MNRIIEARRVKSGGGITAKNFEILVSEGEERKIVIIPPLKSFDAQNFEGIEIVFDNALIPFSETVCADAGDEILFAANQAVKYIDGGDKNVLAALGDLIVAYVNEKIKRSYSPAVELVRAEIEKSVSDCGFSVKDYLKSLPLSGEYIRKLFKKETGISPSEYLTNERMKLARQFLAGGAKNKFSEYSVSQIAEACGFSEPLYFSRVFKKYFGVSPSDYRKPNGD